MKTFASVTKFHGHACPGLALGYRVSALALRELGSRDEDEELLAQVENDSCAVDAVQVVTGCTFGKGNLIFNDFGKQVYTFIKRPGGEALRISVIWEAPEESKKERELWQRYSKGDRSEEVLRAVHSRKSAKIKAILKAPDQDLFKVKKLRVKPPGRARLFPSIRCSRCGEKTMEPRARLRHGQPMCLPCSEK